MRFLSKVVLATLMASAGFVSAQNPSCPSGTRGVNCCPTVNRKVLYMVDSVRTGTTTTTSMYADLKQAADTGYNVIIIGYMFSWGTSSGYEFGPYQQSAMNTWQSSSMGVQGSGTMRANAVDYVHNKFGCVLMGVGGYQHDQWWTYNSATQYGITLSPFVKTGSSNNYGGGQWDGVDLDFMFSNGVQVTRFYGNGVFGGSGTTDLAIWLTSMINQLKTSLGAYIVTIGPQSNLFGPSSGSSTDNSGDKGGFTYINTNAGSSINWYNIKYYGRYEYYSCSADTQSGIWTDNCGSTSLGWLDGITSYGIPTSKVVIMKPTASILDLQSGGTFTYTGYVSPTTFGNILRSATTAGKKFGGHGAFKYNITTGSPYLTWLSSVGTVTNSGS